MSILLQEYDPRWPVLFAREAERIQLVPGGRVVRLEHAGSTSVPGLIAKPIIDIVLVVSDSGYEDAWLPALVEAGYALRIREPEWFAHRMLKGPDTDINLHVFSAQCPETERMVQFRDRLRTDETDRELSARTKRELAQREWGRVQDYADAKGEVIAEIMTRC